MKVKELRDILEGMDDDNDIVVSNSNLDYAYEIGLVQQLNGISVIEIEPIEEGDEDESDEDED